MPESKKATADTPNPAWAKMNQKWSLLHDLLGGTLVMRAAGKKWLPLEDKEEEPQYKNRLARSYLFNALRDTIDKLVAKPFSKPLTIQGTIPEQLEGLEENADRNGRDLTAFGRDLFEDLVTYGKAHVLVDFPRVMNTEGETPTLADERDAEIGPFFVRISPTDLIGWRTARAENGEEVVTQARIKDIEVREDGDFGEIEVKIVWVWTADTWQKWELPEGDEDYILSDEGVHTFGAVPLFTVYIKRTGVLTSDPPLDDLAWLNLAHWQSLSDQRNILRYARVPLLLAAGFSTDEVEAGITLGPNQLVHSTNAEAKLMHVEHTGKAIAAGEVDLQRLEERMESLGLQPLTQKSGNITATGKAIDEGKTHTAIQAWIRTLESFFDVIYRAAARWINVEITDDEFAVDINNDFGISLRAADDIKALLEARMAREISRETFLREMKRRGLLAEGTDIELEIDALESEGPSLSEFGSDPFGGDADPEADKDGGGSADSRKQLQE